MFKKSSIHIYIRLIVITFAVILLSTILNVSLIFNSISDGDRLSYASFTIGIELLLIISSIIILLVIRKVLNRIELERCSHKKIIRRYQQEINKQAKMIDSLTSLYNNAIEHDILKTEFFSNMSHELKTPLSIMLGAIQLMQQTNCTTDTKDDKASKNLKVIKQNCFRLLRLINNILDITKIDSGYSKVNLVNCNIIYLIEEITLSVSPYAEQKGLILEFDTEAEEIITGVDIDKIERIILNLLSNAIKFTGPNGKITVHIKNMKDSVFISVKDTGPGIPKNMHSEIFERFRQVDSSFTRQFEGSGIGLSLVKSFVELHDGHITLKSEENKGSEFVIELPIKLCESNIEGNLHTCNQKSKIINSIRVELSDIYFVAS